MPSSDASQVTAVKATGVDGDSHHAITPSYRDVNHQELHPGYQGKEQVLLLVPFNSSGSTQ